eukprot:7294484-Alexandrium_andersonii.AAC.1
MLSDWGTDPREDSRALVLEFPRGGTAPPFSRANPFGGRLASAPSPSLALASVPRPATWASGKLPGRLPRPASVLRPATPLPCSRLPRPTSVPRPATPLPLLRSPCVPCLPRSSPRSSPR